MAILWRFDADGTSNAGLTTSTLGSTDSAPVDGVTKSGTAVVSINNASGTARSGGEHIFVSQKLANQTCRVEKSLGSTRATYGFRFYIRWASTPGAVTSFAGGYLSGTEVWHLRRASNTRLTIQTGATLISNAPTTSTANNTWYRVEGTCSSSGVLVVNVYTGDGTTALLTLNGTSSAMDVDGLRFGAVTSTANLHPDMKMDEFYVHDSATEPGPWFAVPAVNDSVTTTAPGVTFDVGAAALPTDASVTTTAPSAGFTAEAVTTFRKVDNVSYDDGTGDADRRFADLYIPFGTPPAGGWPVVMFTHGGGFNAGSEDDLSGAAGARVVRDSIGKGFALMSVRYKRTDFFFDNNLGWTRPHSVQDVLCAAKWIDTQSTYDLNSAFIVGLGYSAGGHLIMESALLAEDSTPNSYDAVYRGQSPGGTPGTTGPLGNRYTGYPALSHTGGRTGIPTFKGVFSMGGPWDLPRMFADNILIIGVLGLYYGARPSTGSLVNSVGKEGDLGSFVEGRTGTIYDARTATPPSFPIGITYSTGDTTVPTSCSYTPMRSSLDTVGYDVSQDSNGNVATGVALSRYGYAGTGGAGGHDTIPTQYDSTFYSGWLDEVIALQASGVDDSVTTTAPSVTAAVGTAVVTLGNAVTTTAPAASLGVGTAAVTTALGTTTTAPVATAAVGTAAVTISAAATTTAPAATVSVGSAAITIGAALTTTAPAVVASVGTAAVTTARAVTSVAPLAALSVGSATATPAQPVTTTAPALTTGVGSAVVTTSRAVTTTAPELTVGVGATVGSAARSDAVTTTAPAAALGVGAAAAGISAGATTTAPGATTSVGATTVSVSCAVTTTAPGVALSAALPAVTCSVSVQLSAAVVSSAVPVPVVGTAASSSTTITAPAVASTVPSVTVNISVSVSVTTTAPAVATQAGTPLTQGDVAVAVMAAAVGYSLGVLSAEALGLVFYVFTGSEHVPAQLRYTDGAGLDVPVTLELAE